MDRTADRLGFILADSLAAALSMIEAAEPQLPEERQARADELRVFAASPAYLALRQQAGIVIE